ncbi:MAG TPA: aldo/keto reductase [Opitutaceae bacterium]|nr:aldo/keto reductase [Opitutaceae bacterium]HRJ47052.1 aldo/keto reductase [Opitutaceae bacterium]
MSAACGLGCVTFGREIDALTARAMLDHACSRGLRHLDTSVVYGGGTSEAIIGQWLAERRPTGMVVATKMVPPYGTSAIAAGVAASLRRLALPKVDIFYLHRDDPGADDDTLRALDAEVRAGRVERLGISNVRPARLAHLLARQTALGLTPFRVLQCNHNLAVTELDDAMRTVVAAGALEVVTFSPLGAGFLTGKHRAGVAAGSRFDLVPGHQSIYFKPDSHVRLEALMSLAAETGHEPARLALAWALTQPGVATVLIGGRSPAAIDQALASRAPLGPVITARLESIAKLTA